MYKALLKDTSLYSLSIVLARGFSIITVPIFTRILSPSDYGALDLLSYAAVFIPIVFSLALDQAVARFYIDATELKKTQIASTVIFYYGVVLFVVALIAMSLSNYLAIHWLNDQVNAKTVCMAFIFMWVRSFYYAANNQLKYMFESRKFALSNIGNTILSALLSVYFIAYLKWGVFGLFLGQSISQAVFSGVSLYYGRRSYAFIFHLGSFWEMTHYSLPLVPSTLAVFGMQYIDRYALKELSGLSDVGIYGVGARLASLIELFLIGFNTAWSPLMLKNYMNPDAEKQFARVFQYFVFIMSSVLTVISLFGKELLLVLTTAAFSLGYVVVPLLIGSSVLATVANYFSFGIEISKKTSWKAYMNIAGLFVNFIFNIVFIKAFGLIGAALATFTTFLIMALIGMTISQKLYYVPYKWGKIISTFAIALGVSSIVIFHPFSSSYQTLFVKTILCIITIAVFLEIIKIVSIREMWSFGQSFLSRNGVPMSKIQK